MIDTPKCSDRKCKHYIGIKNDGDELSERPYCKAFEDGIPNDISYGNNKHLNMVKGQKNNVIFEV